MDLSNTFNNIPHNEHPGDYIKDGVLFCGNCNTPKEIVMNTFGGKCMPVLCKCAAAERVRIEAAYKMRERQDRIQKNIRDGIADKRYLDWTFGNDDKSNLTATVTAKMFVDEWQTNKAKNKGLLFVGDVGVGKTYLACAIANELLQQGVTVFVTDLPTLLKRATDFNDDALCDIERCSLLVIDDVGVERSTEFATEQIYNIINARYKTGKPLIVTTNLTPQEMNSQKNVEKRRIYDRILEMCCTTVVMDGESRRPGIRKEKQKA